MKRKLYIFSILIIVVAVAVQGYIELNKQVIKAEMVWGMGIDRNLDKYRIINSNYDYIESNQEQYNLLQDNSRVNIDYVVVYTEDKWFGNNRKALKLLRFERPFPDHDLQTTNTMYYKLVDESIEYINENHSVFIRLYEKYEQHHNIFGLVPVPIIIPNVGSVQEARAWIQSNEPELMKLLPLTVVEPNLKEEWDNDNYVPEFEYSIKSPSDLTVQDIINNN